LYVKYTQNFVGKSFGKRKAGRLYTRLHDDTKTDRRGIYFENIKWVEERQDGIHLHVWVHELPVTHLYLATHHLHTHAHAHAFTHTRMQMKLSHYRPGQTVRASGV